MKISKENILGDYNFQTGSYKFVIKNITESNITTKKQTTIPTLIFNGTVFINEKKAMEKSFCHFISDENIEYKQFVMSILENYQKDEIDFKDHINTSVQADIVKKPNGYYVLKSYKPIDISINSSYENMNIKEQAYEQEKQRYLDSKESEFGGLEFNVEEVL